ncbi:MAG: hypothetical protein J0M24_11090 [Verrucomicrobia bacterium]|nr:hypothetical protein [Verrucomicrobiota bacterium]
MRNGIRWAAALIAGSQALFAQPAVLQQLSLGGTGSDRVRTLLPWGEHGVLLGGDSASETNAVKKAPRQGLSDFWIVATAPDGRVLWDRTYGGSSAEELTSLVPAQDDEFLLGGTSSSPVSGTKSAPLHGGPDFWLTRIDSQGTPRWDRSFGGPDIERLAQALPLADGGFLLTGYSDSDVGGNKTEPSRGGSDGWLVRINSAGELLWQRAYGGIGTDTLDAACELPDGGFLVVGDSDSPPGGDKGDGSHGLGDVWILRLDREGQKLWDRTYGGSNVEYAHDLIGLPDGGAVLVATSLSGISGNKISPSRGGGATADAYVIRFDGQGNRIWEQTYGGSSVDLLVRGTLTQDGLLLAGYSSSAPSGNKISPHLGWDDLWLVRINLDGGLLWETTHGSEGSEQGRAVAVFPDGTFLSAGHLLPIQGKAPALPLFGSDDFYLIRLASDQPQLRATAGPPFRLALTGATHVWHRLDVSSDLRNWTPWRTNRWDAFPVELDDEPQSLPRFYRAGLVPQP